MQAVELKEPFDREKLREERRARNKEKREKKKLENLKKNISIKISNNLTIITPEFNNNYQILKDNKNEKELNINLCDLINSEKKLQVKEKQISHSKPIYNGNRLDSDQPPRYRGKQREGEKKHKVTALKRKILAQENFGEVATRKCNGNPVTEALNTNAECFIREIVVLQEKLYKRDPVKGDLKRKYVIGFRELQKNLLASKVKIAIFAADIKITNGEDPLHEKINEIINIAKAKEIPYIFALKRRILGKLTLKFVPVSCIGILNCDGAFESYQKLIDEIFVIKEQEQRIETEISSKVNDKLLQTFKELIID